MLTEAIKQCVEEKVEACFALAEAHFQRTFLRPTISFNQRGKIAGSARLQVNELRFSPVLLSQNQQAFYRDVIPHEVSHLICFQLYGKVRPHGHEWQRIMREVYKRPPHTRHQFDVTDVSGATYPYQCLCQQHQLSQIRHNKVLRGKAVYHCRQCRSPLNYSPN